MKIDVQLIDDKVHVTLDGKMYFEEAAELKEELLKYTDKPNFNILIDMANLHFIDSSGLGVLVGFQKKTLQHDGKIVLKGLQGDVKYLFELTRLTSVFEMAE